MSLVSTADLIALFWFLAAWIGYSAVIEMTPARQERILGWFLGPLPLIATTAAIVVVMWRRQFASMSSAAVRATRSGA